MKKFLSLMVVGLLSCMSGLSAGEVFEPIDRGGEVDPIQDLKNPGNEGPVPRQVIEGGTISGDTTGNQPGDGPVVDPTQEPGPGTIIAREPVVQGGGGNPVVIIDPVNPVLPVNVDVINNQTALPKPLQDRLIQLATDRQAGIDALSKSGLDKTFTGKIKSFFSTVADFFTGKSTVDQYVQSTAQANDLVLTQMRNIVTDSVTQISFGPLTTGQVDQINSLQNIITLEVQQFNQLGQLARNLNYKPAERQKFAILYTKLSNDMSQVQNQANVMKQVALDQSFGAKVLFTDISKPTALNALGINDTNLSEDFKTSFLSTLQKTKAQLTPDEVKTAVDKALNSYNAVLLEKPLSSPRGVSPEEQPGYNLTIGTYKAVKPIIDSLRAQANTKTSSVLLAAKLMPTPNDPYTQLKNAVFAQAYDYKTTYLSPVEAFAQLNPTKIDAWSTMIRNKNNIFIQPQDAQNFATLTANLTRLSSLIQKFQTAIDGNKNDLTQAMRTFGRGYTQLLDSMGINKQEVITNLKDQQNTLVTRLQEKLTASPVDQQVVDNLKKQSEYISMRIQALATPGQTGGNSGTTTPVGKS